MLYRFESLNSKLIIKNYFKIKQLPNFEILSYSKKTENLREAKLLFGQWKIDSF